MFLSCTGQNVLEDGKPTDAYEVILSRSPWGLLLNIPTGSVLHKLLMNNSSGYETAIGSMFSTDSLLVSPADSTTAHHNRCVQQHVNYCD